VVSARDAARGRLAALLDEAYQWKLLKATLGHEIEEQLKYHKANITSASDIDRLLHWFGVACFFVTFAILCVFLLAYIGYYLKLVGPLDTFKSLIVLASAGLPALGAAVAGIRVPEDIAAWQELYGRKRLSLPT
jgi:hypothetical protein